MSNFAASLLANVRAAKLSAWTPGSFVPTTEDGYSFSANMEIHEDLSHWTGQPAQLAVVLPPTFPLRQPIRLDPRHQVLQPAPSPADAPPCQSVSGTVMEGFPAPGNFFLPAPVPVGICLFWTESCRNFPGQETGKSADPNRKCLQPN